MQSIVLEKTFNFVLQTMLQTTPNAQFAQKEWITIEGHPHLFKRAINYLTTILINLLLTIYYEKSQ